MGSMAADLQAAGEGAQGGRGSLFVARPQHDDVAAWQPVPTVQGREVGGATLSDVMRPGRLALPQFPGRAALSAEDWALKLTVAEGKP